MLSSEGEKVQLSQVISTSEARGAVEKWLLQVQDTMLMSVRDVIAASREAYAIEAREDWVKDWPRCHRYRFSTRCSHLLAR